MQVCPPGGQCRKLLHTPGPQELSEQASNIATILIAELLLRANVAGFLSASDQTWHIFNIQTSPLLSSHFPLFNPLTVPDPPDELSTLLSPKDVLAFPLADQKQYRKILHQ